jgi:hypothetical protein
MHGEGEVQNFDLYNENAFLIVIFEGLSGQVETGQRFIFMPQGIPPYANIWHIIFVICPFN